MEKIGFYKVGLPIYFNSDDHRSWSAECRSLLNILSNNFDAYIMSDTNYEGIRFHMWAGERLDRVYVMNGPGEIPDFECDDVRLIVTDLALYPEDTSRFTHVYTQSRQLGEYAYIETAPLYHANTTAEYPKTEEFYFGGTERNRTKDFFEYVWRPGHLWHGKSKTMNVRDDIPFDEHLKVLQSAKYTIVIGDEAYNHIGFVTPRYYECLIQGVIPFVDDKFDPDGLIPIPKELRVKSYVEMVKKMQMWTEEDRLEILAKAKSLLPKKASTGNYILNVLSK